MRFENLKDLVQLLDRYLTIPLECRNQSLRAVARCRRSSLRSEAVAVLKLSREEQVKFSHVHRVREDPKEDQNQEVPPKCHTPERPRGAR